MAARTVKPQGQTIELRPDWEQYGQWFRRPPVVLLPLVIVLFGSLIYKANLTIAAVAVVAGVGIALAGATLSIRTSSIRLGDGRIEHRSWFVRRKVIGVDGNVRGLLARYSPALESRTSELLVVQAGCSGPKIRLNGAFWKHQDLVAIATFAGVEITDQELTAKDYEHHAPQIMYARERHPIVWVVVASLVFFVVLFVAIAGVLYAVDKTALDDQPPKQVSAATVSTQNRVLADLQKDVDGSWSGADIRLGDCEKDDDSKGWRRYVSSDLDSSAPLPESVPDLLPTIRNTLAAFGLEEVSSDAEGSAIIVRSTAENPLTDDRSVEIVFDQERASIDIRGACEVQR